MNRLVVMIVVAAAAALGIAPSTAADLCRSGVACECRDGLVSCTKSVMDGPLVVPDNATSVRFVDSFVDRRTFDGDTLRGAQQLLRSVTWTASRVASVGALRFDALARLDLSANDIAAVADGAFDGCPRLEYVDLSGNRLTVLPDAMFANTRLLQTVKLENNAFHAVPERLFGTTTVNVKNLSIGNPLLTVIPANAMASLDKLEFLNVENSGIVNVYRNSFGQHPNLNSISFDNCTRLSTIDDDVLRSAPNVETIRLNNCGTIDFLPPSIISLKNLKRLYMSETEVRPECHNGWISQWFIETTVVEGYKKLTQFTDTVNGLKCPAKIYHTSDPITLKLTKQGVIDCVTYGNPRPAITWLVPGGLTFHENKEADKNITHHPKAHNCDLNRIDNPSLLTNTNGSLHITRMLRTNVGNYTCYVSNQYGNDSKTTEVHLDSEVFFNIKINALILGIASALGFLMLTILCCAFKLLLIRLNCIKKRNQQPAETEIGTTEKSNTSSVDV